MAYDFDKVREGRPEPKALTRSDLIDYAHELDDRLDEAERQNRRLAELLEKHVKPKTLKKIMRRKGSHH